MASEGRPFIFRINENGSGPNLLVQVCAERGWREYNEGAASRDNWNLWWRSQGFPVALYKSLKSWQFTNHIPKASSICRKDSLARFLRCMRNVYGSVYDFSPPVYNLPLEFNKLVAECSRTRMSGIEEEDVWICKPVGQSQGRGIYLFRKLSELTYDTNTIVQRYIRNPFLIGGYKFDLRLYVCVPSYHPLTVYMYREGLVRFSTDKFSLNDLNNPFCHLTNSSLNKLGPGYYEMKDRVGSGCKWTLKQLRHYLAQAGLCDWLLWQRVAAIVVLTVLSQVPSIPPTANCFEFLGFDILVDSALRPWLLEVNLSPALGNDCDVDPAVKKPMLHDLFDLLGLPVCNTGLQLFTLWSSPDARAANGGGASPCSSTSPLSASPRVPAGGSLRGGGSGAPSLSPVPSRTSPAPRRGTNGANGAAAGGRRGRERTSATEVAVTAVHAAMRWRRKHGHGRTAPADGARSQHASGEDTAEDDEASCSSLAGVAAPRGTRRVRRRSARRGCSAGSVASSQCSQPRAERSRPEALGPALCVTALTGTAVGSHPATPRRATAGNVSSAIRGMCGSDLPPGIFAPQPAPPLRVTQLSVATHEGGSLHGGGGGPGGASHAPRAKSASRRSDTTAWAGPVGGGRRAQTRLSLPPALSPAGRQARQRPAQPTLRTRRTRSFRPMSASTAAGASEEPWGRGVLPPGMQPARVRGARVRGRCPAPSLWGNGKDWSRSSAGEGGWVRIFPVGGSCEALAAAATVPGPAPGAACGGPMAAGEGLPAASFGDTVVRRAVYDINRMLRVARDVARKYPKASDCDRNKALAQALAFSGDPWLPFK